MAESGFDWGGAIGGLFSGVGSIWSGMQAQKGQEDANQLQMDLANKQMDFQRNMYASRHQMEVEDLRRAGLNPILSANSAGVSPMGSQAVVQNTMGNWPGAMANSGRAFSDVAKMLADIKVANNMANKLGTDKEVNNTQVKINEKSLERLDALTSIDQNNAKVVKSNTDWELSKYGRFMHAIGMITNPVRGLFDVKKLIDSFGGDEESKPQGNRKK